MIFYHPRTKSGPYGPRAPFRWNTILKRMEYWSSGNCWCKCYYVTNLKQGKKLGRNLVSYRNTWCEPICEAFDDDQKQETIL